MKLIVLSIISLLFLCASDSWAQETIFGSIMHDNIERDYVLYVPEMYDSAEEVPLVFNFHGYTSNAAEQILYGDFRKIADTANFILVVPEGTVYQGNTHWNVGGWTIGSPADDVGFTAALLEELKANYTINADRVYSTGMSNGGFMSYLLACQLSDKFAAIASVTGSMTPQTYNNCDAQHPTPILEIHGTSDPIVAYNGASWTKSISDVIDYWVNYNMCDPSAEIINVENTSTTDGSTVEHQIYTGGENGVEVEHLKIIGGAHTWPGTVVPSQGTNYDINASQEIWRFFSQYDIDGKISISNNLQLADKKEFTIYPNPAEESLVVEHDLDAGNYEILDMSGHQVTSGELSHNNSTIALANIASGLYFIRINSSVKRFVKL